jgi:predicted Zn-dependent protease
MKNLMKNLTLASILFLIFSGCARNPVTGKKQFVLMSESQEIAMGQQADPEIIAMFGLYQDEKLQAFIQEKGDEMAKVSHRPKLNYKFRVVDSPIINAFAVPGGYVYFTRGIMAHFNNEAEFAGVLGHEIGHITARHSVVQQRNTLLAQIGLMAGVIALPELASFIEPASVGMGLLLLKFGRDAERESDKLGVDYSSKVGYDARHMGQFFTTIERTQNSGGGQAIPDFLSSHPNPGDRYNTVNKMASDWQSKNPSTPLKVNRESFLKRIDGMVYGEDPRQGFVENQKFYHPELKFEFSIPSNWNHKNSPSQFQMAPKDGKALLALTLAEGNNAESAATNFATKHKLSTVEKSSTQVNGLKAVRLIADQIQEQNSIRTQTYFIEYGGIVYAILGVSLLSDFSSYQSIFTTTSSSFKTLTDSDKLNRKPDRLVIKKLTKSQTLSEALKSYNMPSSKYEELAILNGLELNDVIQSGDYVKIIGQ